MSQNSLSYKQFGIPEHRMIHHIMFVAILLYCSYTGFVRGGEGEYQRVCMMDDQSQYRPEEGQFTTDDLSDVTMCTHLVYNYALVDVNGTGLKVSGDYEEGNYQVISTIKNQRAGLTVLLGVGGPRGSKGFADVVNSTDTVDLFTAGVVQFVRDRNFEGVVIDWTHDEEDQSNLEGFALLLYGMSTTFLSEAAATGKSQLLFGVVMTGDRDSIDTYYPLEAISTYADLIFVKGYDLYTPEVPLIGHQSSLFARDEEDGYVALLNVDFSVRYLLYSGIPASKLILGIPTHGLSQRFINESLQFFGADSGGYGSVGPYSQSPGYLTYFEICQLLGKGWTESFHEGHQVPFAFNNEEIITYDNTDSIRLKINYVKDNQLGGVFISSLGDDDFSGLFCNQGQFPLTTSLHEYFQRSRDKCFPGEFGAIDISGCTPCPLGTYQPDFYQTQCVSCPDGQTTLTSGAIADRQCLVDCPSGSEYSFFQKECTECPLGFHRKAGAQGYCEKCPDGQTTVTKASSHCVDQPESVGEQPVNRVDVAVTLLFHVTSCDNKPVIMGIISQLLEKFVLDLSSTWSDLCKPGCSNAYFSNIKECHAGRQKRAGLHRTVSPSNQDDSIEVSLALKNVSQDVENSKITRRVDKILTEAFDGTTVFSSLDLYGVHYLGLKDLSTSVVCGNGSAVTDKMACVPCTVGTFLNRTSLACEACPVGTYQDEEEMTSCRSCDDTKTTMTSGSTLSSQCVSPCQAKPNYCYNNGLCHWAEGDSTTIYCQCADGYVGERCENRKAYYMDNGAITGTVIGAVSAFLILCLIILSCVICTRYSKTRRQSVEVIDKMPKATSDMAVSSSYRGGNSPNVSKGINLPIDYFDYNNWLNASQHHPHQQDIFYPHIHQQQQQRPGLHQSSRRVSRHRSMPSSSTGFSMYGIPQGTSDSRENTTLPRPTAKYNSIKTIIGEY